MIPLRDDVATRRFPVVVSFLMAACVLAYAGELLIAWRGADENALQAFIERWALVPRELLRGVRHPGTTSFFIWLTPFTSMFLHGGLLHLLGNLLYLWIFGRSVEDLMGVGRFVLFYAACGLAAALLHLASAPNSYLPTLGASGAISGVLGAYALLFPSARLRLLVPLPFLGITLRVPALLFLVLWFALQISSAWQTPAEGETSIAWWAHLGGFVAGAVLAHPMKARAPARRRRAL